MTTSAHLFRYRETFKTYTGIKFTLEYATMAQREKRGVAPLFP